MIAAVRNSENAVDRADRAADTRADRAADQSPHRSGRTAALSRAFLRAADDALCVPEMGDRQQCESKRRGRKITLAEIGRPATSMP